MSRSQPTLPAIPADLTALAERAAAATVGVEIPSPHGETTRRVPGVVTEPGCVSFFLGYLSGQEAEALRTDLSVVHRETPHRARIEGIHPGQRCCRLSVQGLDVAPAPVRWSRTLQPREPLIAIRVAEEPAAATLGVVWHLQRLAGDLAWERSYAGLARFLGPLGPGHLLFDHESRLVGCAVDFLDPCGTSVGFLPGEGFYGIGRVSDAAARLRLGDERDLLEVPLESVGDDTRLLGAHAQAAALHERTGRALDALDRLLALDPENAWAHCQRATALTRFGHETEAAAALERARILDPDRYDWQRGAPARD